MIIYALVYPSYIFMFSYAEPILHSTIDSDFVK